MKLSLQNITDAINRDRIVRAVVALLPEDLSSYQDLTEDNLLIFPNGFIYKQKIIPTNWDGVNLTLKE